MKAIETIYNGYKFRSRLEARWAVFFDALGLRYEYEKEGFNLDGIFYLPDFFIENLGCEFWIEIKGSRPNESELQKAKLLARHSGQNVYIFWDDPKDHQQNDSGCCYGRVPSYLETTDGVSVSWDLEQGDIYGECRFFECEVCETINIERETIAMGCDCCFYNNYGKQIEKACNAARQARFEHGESPQTESKRYVYGKPPTKKKRFIYGKDD